MSILRECVRRILLETVGKVYYHGRGGPVHFDEGKPAWFTDDKEAAKWYAYERGSGTPTIYSARLTFTKSAPYRVLEKVVDELGLDDSAISANSPYYGENPNDYIYVPAVQRRLEELGYDAFHAWDVLTNEEVPVTVVWHPSQVHIVGSETADEFDSTRFDD